MNLPEQVTLAIIGGGAAGIFAANHIKLPPHKLAILEKGSSPLAKLKISGGGRCNVTHHCYEISELVKHYPRGHKALIGPFYRFQPKDTVAWFEKRGLKLKVEEDGRMFPVTDRSQSVIDCLLSKISPSLHLSQGVKSLEKTPTYFLLHLASGNTLKARYVLLASGSSRQGYQLAKSMGHALNPPVPSLFTFNLPSSPFLDLPGISVKEVKVSLPEVSLSATGPLLLTHWGFSGPAILKLSAWGARALQGLAYRTQVHVDWLPLLSHKQVFETLSQAKNLLISPFAELSKRLWQRWLSTALPTFSARVGSLKKKQLVQLAEKLKKDPYFLEGKTSYKQEFVTCGGVQLDGVDFKTMESKYTPGLFFAGELLDIDGVTGGFNFQAAWTSAYLAATHINHLNNLASL